jgi:hypothetical protein
MSGLRDSQRLSLCVGFAEEGLSSRRSFATGEVSPWGANTISLKIIIKKTDSSIRYKI